jgi:hypothetical protein
MALRPLGRKHKVTGANFGPGNIPRSPAEAQLNMSTTCGERLRQHGSLSTADVDEIPRVSQVDGLGQESHPADQLA